MNTNDGHRLAVRGHTTKVVSCSRWTELIEGLKFHAELANTANALTEFRFLNGHDPILVGLPFDSGSGFHEAMTTFSTLSPNGRTPLCRQIQAVIDSIKTMEPNLRANGQSVVLTIATDGESTDGNIADALKPLENLPVLVVIRLCTDAEDVVNYWNNVDAELELALDVLDDLHGEAGEVSEFNKWLTYGEPLHHLREFGMTLKEFDLLDETKLSYDQMRLMCALFVGDGYASELPDPTIDWQAFYNAVDDRVKVNDMTYCPRKDRMRPWINMKQLSRAYGPHEGCVVS
eukprot:CAMPEP_0182416452 /NCGR_PEP_ID=MMETSP1167-20130531/740_1 /TAXON_ID=2988 /ORGANISM="Mallomonas Sp, Strain CCMP3275" /LENGTH=288 /DNA_ID=CAMNT_0024589213 /DNA_START=218 /DNA_END=1087 /DNA_ORIENTATION=+